MENYLPIKMKATFNIYEILPNLIDAIAEQYDGQVKTTLVIDEVNK